MILYYALGGGLGHIARSFALIAHAPKKHLPGIRLLVSSKSADVARPCSPCPMDLVPDWAMGDRALYSRFLHDYIEQHSFTCMILDTFPFGLLGELKHAPPDLPRLMVGRYLRWDAYRKRCAGLDGAVWPRVAVMIEQQDVEYLDETRRHGRIINAQWPVSLARIPDMATPGSEPSCCVIHSGPQKEVDSLIVAARRIMSEQGITGIPEVFTPEKGLFPMEHYASRFSHIVTGAGYAGCAAAAVLRGSKRYHLQPFPRRFDDQALRLRRLREGRWGDGPVGDASTVAALLWGEIQ